MPAPTLDDIRTAHDRIRPYVHRTPVVTCGALDRMAGARLFFKCEQLQKVGAFKARGAANAVFSLGEHEARRGVATHSSGNHAAALSWAAAMRGITAHVVMPSNAPAVKRAAVESYGGQITSCEPTQAAREATIEEVVRRTHATVIHPYNDERIIAGQATATVELLEDVPELDAVVAPVGGGGLLSGTVLAVKGLRPGLEVYGAEPAWADDAYRSLQAGRILPAERFDSVADGLRTSLGDKTFPILWKLLDGIALAEEAEIVAAMRLLIERTKILTEPSSAVPLAALLGGRLPLAGRRVGVILTGGNVDLARLPFGV